MRVLRGDGLGVQRRKTEGIRRGAGLRSPHAETRGGRGGAEILGSGLSDHRTINLRESLRLRKCASERGAEDRGRNYLAHAR